MLFFNFVKYSFDYIESFLIVNPRVLFFLIFSGAEFVRFHFYTSHSNFLKCIIVSHWDADKFIPFLIRHGSIENSL